MAGPNRFAGGIAIVAGAASRICRATGKRRRKKSEAYVALDTNGGMYMA